MLLLSSFKVLKDLVKKIDNNVLFTSDLDLFLVRYCGNFRSKGLATNVCLILLN